MVFSEKEKLYKWHSKNYAKIRGSLSVIEKNIRKSIIESDRESQKSLILVYMLLIGASAESRLHKILFEPNKFTEGEIIKIFNTNTHLNKWILLVQTAFRKKNNTSNLEVMPFQDMSIYRFLIETLENELRIIIEIRNKLAHGQWVYPFVNLQSLNSLEDIKISDSHEKLFNRENMLTLKLKKKMIDSLLNIVRDLVVSYDTLSRDVNNNYITEVTQRDNNMLKYS